MKAIQTSHEENAAVKLCDEFFGITICERSNNFLVGALELLLGRVLRFSCSVDSCTSYRVDPS